MTINKLLLAISLMLVLAVCSKQTPEQRAALRAAAVNSVDGHTIEKCMGGYMFIIISLYGDYPPIQIKNEVGTGVPCNATEKREDYGHVRED